jgi:hypothetical protein
VRWKWKIDVGKRGRGRYRSEQLLADELIDAGLFPILHVRYERKKSRDVELVIVVPQVIEDKVAADRVHLGVDIDPYEFVVEVIVGRYPLRLRIV